MIYLDCGCAVDNVNGGRNWCPSCLEPPKPDPLPTEEELAQELQRIHYPRPVDHYDDIRAAKQWDRMNAVGREAFLRQARFILSHLKPGGWRA